MSNRVELTVPVDVNAPAERVWRMVTDWPGQSEWMLGTRIEIEGTGDARHLGGRFRAFTGIGPLGAWDPMEIVEWDPPKRCVVRHLGAVVQGDDAAVHLNATASETITITNISNGDSNTINIYPGSGATAAPNAGDLNSGNSNGPGADTFPGDGDGDCDPLTEDCDDDPGDGDCDPETEDCEGEGGGCDPDEETCGGTFLGKALSAKTFGKSTADFMTDVRGTPLGEAISDVESNMPSGGNCPAPTIDLTDWNMGSYTFDTHCVLLEEWRSQIRISMLAFYALLGIFVFLRRS